MRLEQRGGHFVQIMTLIGLHLSDVSCSLAIFEICRESEEGYTDRGDESVQECTCRFRVFQEISERLDRPFHFAWWGVIWNCSRRLQVDPEMDFKEG